MLDKLIVYNYKTICILVMNTLYCVLLDSVQSQERDFHDKSLWNYLLPNPIENVIFLHNTHALELVTDTYVSI